jgi:hypothetical protein
VLHFTIELAKLKDWQYSKKSASKNRAPLTYCELLSEYFRARGGDEGVAAFLNLADQKLGPLISDDKNDYVQKRAQELEARIHKMFSR